MSVLELPLAPPVARPAAAQWHRPRASAMALFAIGVLMIIGPIAGGLFADAAAGQQMIDRFGPHMDPDALARYDHDVAVLRQGAAGIDTAYQEGDLPSEKFAGVDGYRARAAAINGRAAELLRRIEATQPDYQRVASISGFARIPFLIVGGGVVAAAAGGVLLLGRRSRTVPGIAITLVASIALAAYPFIGGLRSGSQAGHRMLRNLAPVMILAEVRQLQSDFVVTVEAVGELDAGAHQLSIPGPAGAAVAELVSDWPTVSSDLASLVGAVNDNIGDFDALNGLDRLAPEVHGSGLETFPWLMVVTGAVTAGLALESWPRRRRVAP